MVNEHEEMTCGFVFMLTTLPTFSNARIYLIGVLAGWGMLDFKQSIRSYFDTRLVNTTETLNSSNISGLPIICEEMEINGIEVYSYTPVEIAGREKLPLLIYFHGGGGVIYSPKVFDATSRYLANKMKMRIIVPNYSKSPEIVFPTAHEECFNIVKYVFENSKEMRIDSSRVSIGGGSFGSHLSLYVAFKWRELGYDKEHAPLRTMTLIYPWVQMVNLNLESYLRKENQPRILSSYGVALATSLILKGDLNLVNLITDSRLPLLSRNYEDRKSAHPNLLPDIDWNPPPSIIQRYSGYADTLLDPYFTFLFQSDFSHLPPTLIIASEYDILLTEGQLLKERMEEAGGRVQYVLYEKMFHGFCLITPLFKFTPTYDALNKITEFHLNHTVAM